MNVPSGVGKESKPALVRREVTRVVTPGTITEDNLLDPRQHNHLLAFCNLPGSPLAKTSKGQSATGIAWVELSTGQFHAMDVDWARLPDEIARLAPAECLCAEADGGLAGELVARFTPVPALTTRPDWTFDGASALATLHKHFGVLTMGGFGFEDRQPCLVAAGALLLYAQEMLKANLNSCAAFATL